eukprot:TRINITY_DN81487_c0_g1_i1.p1 TRINITY_DN81487_c0_g1~~TRINITY_DN81487_c0_g1_i1.p1  ORF type:complete len:1014 (-),score=193.37 TRINITY_DN81487_c0_g1_i1:160-3159(-)
MESVLPAAPKLWLISWRTLASLGRLPEPSEYDHLTSAVDAHEEHGKNAVMVVVIHRWRSVKNVDPHGATWRQLVSFAQWYRWRWGMKTEPHFWMDWCCRPELSVEIPEGPGANSDPLWANDDHPGEIPEDCHSPVHDPAVIRVKSVGAALSSWESFKESSSNMVRTLSGQDEEEGPPPPEPGPKYVKTAMKKRGLRNLAAWAEANIETDPAKKLRRTDAQMWYSPDPFTLELEARPEVASVDGADAMLPLIFGAADAVVYCESHFSEEDAWVRLYLALAHALAPFGRIVYQVDRRLVHVPKKSKDLYAKRKSEMHQWINPSLPHDHDPFLDDAPRPGAMDMTAMGGSTWESWQPFAMPAVVDEPSEQPTILLPPPPSGLDLQQGDPGMGFEVTAHPNAHPNAQSEEIGTAGDTVVTDFPRYGEVVAVENVTMTDTFNDADGVFNTSGISEITAVPEVAAPAQFANTLGSQFPAWTATSGFGATFNSALGTSLGSDPEWRRIAMSKMLERTKVRIFERDLQDPTDWPAVLVDSPEERGRIHRLTAISQDAPTVSAEGCFRRPALVFGKSKSLVVRLEAMRKERREKPVKHLSSVEEESSSDSSDDEEDRINPILDIKNADEKEEKKYKPKPEFIHQREVKDWEAEMDHLYYQQDHMTAKPVLNESGEIVGAKVFEGRAQSPVDGFRSPQKLGMHVPYLPNKKTDTRKMMPLATTELLRHAADANIGGWDSFASHVKAVNSKRSLQPRIKKGLCMDTFHEEFKSKFILTTDKGRSVMQLRSTDPGSSGLPPSQSGGSGGMAILAKPLELKIGVAPDFPLVAGVFFAITVEEADNSWRDGLGIGFTAQDPDKWPHRKAIPKNALQLPRSCVVGYGGRWFQQGKSELVKGAWEPGKLVAGDVVTAVLCPPPADVVRVLVNGKVVAQKPFSASGLPDPTKEPIWGVVDVESACVRLRTGAGLKMSTKDLAASNSTSLASKWSKHEADIESRLAGLQKKMGTTLT